MTYKQARNERLWLAFEKYAEPEAIMLSAEEHQYTEEEWSDVLPWWQCFKAGAEAATQSLQRRIEELEGAHADSLAFVEHTLEFFNWYQFPHLMESVEQLRDKLKALSSPIKDSE